MDCVVSLYLHLDEVFKRLFRNIFVVFMKMSGLNVNNLFKILGEVIESDLKLIKLLCFS